MNKRQKARARAVGYALATAVALTLISGCGSIADSIGTGKKVEEQRITETSAKAVQTLKVINPSGSLTIIGSDQTDKIEAVASIERTENVPAEDFVMEFAISEGGKHAQFVSKITSNDNLVQYSRMDIKLTVPRHIELNIEDESGPLSVTGMRGALTIDDQSGDMKVKDVTGRIQITDQSGNMDLLEIKGDIEINDDSGNIRLKNNKGNVTLKDGSGNIEVHKHDGELNVTDDSGNVNIEEVKGNIVLNDESGDLNIVDVKGDVRVESDSSGNSKIEQVTGAVHNNSSN